MNSAWGKLEDKGDSITPSELVEVAKSPKHYYSSYILQERETSAVMEEGTLIHKFLLEPEKFNAEYAFSIDESLLEGCPKTTDDLKSMAKDYGLKVSGSKQELIDRVREHDPDMKTYDEMMGELLGGRKILSPEMQKKLRRIKEEVEKHPFASKLIFGDGENEKSGYAHNHTYDCTFRFRLDRFVKLAKRKVIVDVKRTDKIYKRDFERHMFDSKLHMLASIYVDAVKEIEGEEPLFCWVAVQPRPPYLVETFVADFGALEAGRTEAFHAVNTLKQCKETGKWPGPDESLISVALPHWAWGQVEDGGGIEEAVAQSAVP